MKKFLVILMVLAMASVLFVGCTTPPTPEPEPEPEPTPTPTVSATPVLTAVETSAEVSIFTVTSTSTLYMNEDEVGTSILIKGTAPSESLVQLYLDDVAVTPAVGEAEATGLWTIAVAASSLGDDGVKVLTAKVTEVGLAESEASNSVTFTLDTVAPGIDSVAFSVVSALGQASLTIVATSTGPSTTHLLTEVVASGTEAPVQTITAGTWWITAVGASSATDNIAITTPGGVTTNHSVSSNAVVANVYIPGITLSFGDIKPDLAAASVKITIDDAATTAIVGRATIKFDEAVDYTGMAAGTYACAGEAGDPNVYNETNNTGYFTDETALIAGSAGTSYTITVYGVTDKAENVGGTSAVPLTASAAAGVASATSLAP